MRTGKRYIKVQDRRKDLFKIMQVAEMLGTTTRTIRYYEQRGILPPVKRTHGKMRLYTQTDIDILRKTKDMQAQGMHLDQIKAELVKDQQAAVVDRETNKIKIVVDSTACIPFDLARQNGIEIIPMHIVLGESDLQDGIDIVAEQLRLRVEEGRLIPRTEPPSEEEFIAVYSRLYEAGAEHVISIHLSEKISDAVKVARRTSAYMKDFSVTVIDAGTISAGAALMAFAGSGMITAGGSIEQVLAEIETVKKKRSECVVVCSLEKIMGKEKDNTMLQMMLDYKPMLIMENEKLNLRGKPKNDNEVEEQLTAFCREKRIPSYIVVLHANKAAAAVALLARLEKVFPQVPSIIFPYSAVHVANLGNELLGVAIS